jgi:bifunctional polynucleotide phosphatase/kinase
MGMSPSFRIAILSNQGGITLHPDPKAKGSKANSAARANNFKQKCNAVLADLDLPITLYAATGKDIYRKPRSGMWRELCDDYDLEESTINLESSFFVGDAGGRVAEAVAAEPKKKKPGSIPKDFSCSDRNLAHNIGIRYYTPEEFFLGQEPRGFKRDFDLADHPPPLESSSGGGQKIEFERKNKLDLVIFCGPPGAGKSTFYWKHLKPLGYQRVNQDQLKRFDSLSPSPCPPSLQNLTGYTASSRDKCIQAAAEYLKKGESVAVG